MQKRKKKERKIRTRLLIGLLSFRSVELTQFNGTGAQWW